MRETIFMYPLGIALLASLQFFETTPFCEWAIVWQVLVWSLLVCAILALWYGIGLLLRIWKR